MWAKILVPLFAVPLGLFAAFNIDDYASWLRPNNVMAMVEVPGDLMAVPQPRPYPEPAESVAQPVCESQHACCGGTHQWWDRGPVRRTVKWFHVKRPVRKFLGRVFCRRWCC
jgi:hypothetical protein